MLLPPINIGHGPFYNWSHTSIVTWKSTLTLLVLLFLDESMVAFLSEHCPNWVNVKRKLHQYINKYHTIACCDSHIKENDWPKEEPFATAEFEPKLYYCDAGWQNPLVAQGDVLCLIQDLDICLYYLGSTRRICFEQWFSKKKGPGWTRGFDSINIVHHMQGTAVGYQTVRKATMDKYPTCPLWSAATADSNHTSILVNTWTSTSKYAEHQSSALYKDLMSFNKDIGNHLNAHVIVRFFRCQKFKPVGFDAYSEVTGSFCCAVM